MDVSPQRSCPFSPPMEFVEASRNAPIVPWNFHAGHRGWLVTGNAVEVPRVLFLGICLDFHFFPVAGSESKIRFPPRLGFGIPSLGRAYLRSTTTPTQTSRSQRQPRQSTTAYELAHVVRTVNVFSHCIVIAIPDNSGRNGNPIPSKSLVVNKADRLQAVIRMGNEPCCLFSTHNRLVERVQWQRLKSASSPIAPTQLSVGSKRL